MSTVSTWQDRILSSAARPAAQPASDWQNRILRAASGEPQGPDRSVLGEAYTGVQRGLLRGPSQLLSAAQTGLNVLSRGTYGPAGGPQERRGLSELAYRGAQALAPIERGVSAVTDSVLERSFPRSQRDGLWEARGIAGDLGETLPQLSQAIGASIAAGPLGPAGAVAAFAGTSAAPVVGQTYQDALKEHGDQQRAATEATANGAITAATSLIPGMAFLRRVPGGNKVIDAVMRRWIGRVTIRGIAEGGQETVETGGQILFEELIRHGATPEQAWAIVRSKGEEIGYSGVLGTLAGGGAAVAVDPATGPTSPPAASPPRVAPPTTPEAPASPEATQRPPVSALDMTQPEGVRDLVAYHPNAAQQVATGTGRRAFERAGIGTPLSVEQRRRISADVRAEIERARVAGETADVQAMAKPPDRSALEEEIAYRINANLETDALEEGESPATPEQLRRMALEDIESMGDDYGQNYPDRKTLATWERSTDPELRQHAADAKRWRTIRRQAMAELRKLPPRRSAMDEYLDSEPDSDDIQAMALGSTPANFSAPRQAIPITPNLPQPITAGKVPVSGPISEHQVRARLERDFRVPIRRGRITNRGGQKPSGIYKPKPEVIRMLTANFGHVGVATHEVAHHIDNQTEAVKGAPADVKAELAGLDYDTQAARPQEGFAEFVRYALTHDDVAQRAPKTTQWFQQTFLPANPEVAKRLGTARAMIDQWRGQTPQETVRANRMKDQNPPDARTMPERATDAIKNGFHGFYRAMVSSGDPVDAMVREARRQGKVFSDADNPAAVFSSLQLMGPHYMNEAIRGRGIISLVDRKTVLHPPLKDTLALVEDTEYEDAVDFAWARHSREAWAKGIDPGMTRENAEAVYNAHKDNPRFVAFADGLTSFNNALIDMVAETGALRPETQYEDKNDLDANGDPKIKTRPSEADEMKAAWPTYIPLARALGKPGSTIRAATANLDNPMKARHGGDLPIIDPILTMMRRTLGLYERAIRQETFEASVRFADTVGGMGAHIERIPPNMQRHTLTVGDIRKQLEEAGVDGDEIKGVLDDEDALFFYRPSFKTPDGSHIMRRYHMGEQELFQLSPEWFEALDTSARMAGKGPLETAFRWLQVDKAARLQRLGATGVNPSFTLTNLIRDLNTYWLQSKTKNPLRQTAAIPAAMARLFVHNVASIAGKPQSGIVDLFNKVGGTMTSRIGLDYAEMATEIDKALDSPIKRKALKIITSPRRAVGLIGHSLDIVKNVVNATEAAPRLAEFTESLRRDGITEKNIGDATREQIIRALNAAADVTTNFRRAGTMSRAINQYVPFFNARIQGLDKLARTIGDDWVLAAMRLSPLLAITALLWGMRKDDDEYKEEPWWLKFGFWNFTQNGRVVARIPRPHDWGWFFTASFEAALDAIDKQDPEIIQQYLAALSDQMAPSVAPAGLKQGAEVALNVDLWRSNLLTGDLAPLERRGMEDLKPWDRVTPESTILARKVGQFMGWSPIKIDHFLNGITGGAVGRYTNFLEDAPSDPAGAAGQLVGSGVTVRNDYMRSIDEFYDAARDARQAWGSSKPGEGEALSPEDQALSDQNHQMGWYELTMRDLRRLVPPEATRDERYAVNRYIAGLARHAMGKEPMEQFPSPFGRSDLPPEVRAVVATRLRNLRRSANMNAQTADSRDQKRRAILLLRALAAPAAP